MFEDLINDIAKRNIAGHQYVSYCVESHNNVESVCSKSDQCASPNMLQTIAKT